MSKPSLDFRIEWSGEETSSLLPACLINLGFLCCFERLKHQRLVAARYYHSKNTTASLRKRVDWNILEPREDTEKTALSI